MRVGGGKNILIARAMIKVNLLNSAGKNLPVILAENHECKDTNRFLENIAKHPGLVFRAPSIEDCLKFLHVPEEKQFRKAWNKQSGREEMKEFCGDDEDGECKDLSLSSSQKKMEESNSKNLFFLHGFARLKVILRGDQETRAAVINTTEKSIIRRQLYRKASRDSFLEVVERRFNNDEITAKEDFRGRVWGRCRSQTEILSNRIQTER